MLHGRDVLYVLEERAPGRPPLVTDVGVRLPAHLTASGRAILMSLPASQVRALYPTGTASWTGSAPAPTSPSALRTVLSEARQRGHAVEDGEVSPGLASVAAPVLDHNRHPVAGVALTFPVDEGVDRDRLAARGARDGAGADPPPRWPVPTDGARRTTERRVVDDHPAFVVCDRDDT